MRRWGGGAPAAGTRAGGAAKQNWWDERPSPRPARQTWHARCRTHDAPQPSTLVPIAVPVSQGGCTACPVLGVCVCCHPVHTPARWRASRHSRPPPHVSPARGEPPVAWAASGSAAAHRLLGWVAGRTRLMARGGRRTRDGGRCEGGGVVGRAGWARNRRRCAAACRRLRAPRPPPLALSLAAASSSNSMAVASSSSLPSSSRGTTPLSTSPPPSSSWTRGSATRCRWAPPSATLAGSPSGRRWGAQRACLVCARGWREVQCAVWGGGGRGGGRRLLRHAFAESSPSPLPNPAALPPPHTHTARADHCVHHHLALLHGGHCAHHR